MNKGEQFEKDFSKNVFFNEIPLLVSSKLLREKNLGQIDFAKYSKDKIIIYELKNSKEPSKKQLMRLRETSNYISLVLECSIEFRICFCQKRNHSLFY